MQSTGEMKKHLFSPLVKGAYTLSKVYFRAPRDQPCNPEVVLVVEDYDFETIKKG